MEIKNQILPFQDFEKSIQNAQQQDETDSRNRLVFLEQNDKLFPIQFVVIGQLVVNKIKRTTNNQEFDYKKEKLLRFGRNGYHSGKITN